MKSITNYILENISNESTISFEYDGKILTPTDISDAIYSVFQEWEDDSEGWEPPFKIKKTMSDNKSVTDVFDYYGEDTWNDLFKELKIKDSYKNKLKDFCYDNDKEITKILKKTISNPKEYRLRIQGKYIVWRCTYNNKYNKYNWTWYTTDNWEHRVESDNKSYNILYWLVMVNKDSNGECDNRDSNYIVAWHESAEFNIDDAIQVFLAPTGSKAGVSTGSYWSLKYNYSKNPDKYKKMLDDYNIKPTTQKEINKLEKTKQ